MSELDLMETSLLVGPNTTFSNDISLNAVVCVLNSTAPLNGSPAGFKPKEEQVKHLSIFVPLHVDGDYWTGRVATVKETAIVEKLKLFFSLDADIIPCGGFTHDF